jgi:septal ring factor EnvC (AmiA/AmiB activator)
MKIFDSSPGIILRHPSRRRTIVAGATAAAACLALGAALFYQHTTYSAQLAKANHDLVVSQAEVRQLRANLASTSLKLGAAAANVRSCANSLDVETSKVAAFARQAGACEVIRQKLHLASP